MAQQKHWIERVADKVEQNVRQSKGENATIVCASGISPSGPIHLGNLREIMTVHLVSEELRRRGRHVDHIHSWDDFDRLRKVPSGVSEAFSEHIGKPISDVPDPFGEFESYAIRYMVDFEYCMARLGIRPRYIRQSQAYRRRTYTEQIKQAIAKRLEIFDILAEFQTLEREHEKSIEQRRREYYPFRVYCESCHKDFTEIESYDEATATIYYRCTSCGHVGFFSLDERVEGKLVWKVDWPMRWSFEQVDFEPGGEDHSAPGSSFTVGQRIVRDIYGSSPPAYVGYAFVGTTGQAKLSSSAGTGATPRAALDILEPFILRWLYVRRDVGQKFNIDFGQEVLRLYDEWDSFSARVHAGRTDEAERRIHERCLKTSTDNIERSILSVPFRLLSSAADITRGNLEQILRIVYDHLEAPPPHEVLQAQLEPRLSCAIRWATEYLPEEERTSIREAFDPVAYATLAEEHKRGIRLLVERLDEHWSLQGLTKLIYGVPKLLLN